MMKISKILVVITGMVFIATITQVILQNMTHCPALPKPQGFISAAQAIPPWARKYHTSCVTCHAGPGRLNPFGEAFRLNGFKWPNPAGYDNGQILDRTIRTEQPIPLNPLDTGKLKNRISLMKGADLPLTVPVSIRNIILVENKLKKDSILTHADYELEMDFGGTIGNHITYFGHFNYHMLNQPNQPTPMNRTSLFGSISYRNLFNSSLLNLSAGHVGFEEIGLPDLRDHSTQRQTNTSFLFNKTTIPYPSGFIIQNVMLSFRRGPGLQLDGNLRRWRYAIGVTKGMQEGGGTIGSQEYLQMAYKIGGMDYFGRPSGKEYSYAWIERSLSFGIIATSGRTNIIAPDQVQSMDNYWRAGADVYLQWGAFSIKGGYVKGVNNNPYGDYSNSSFDSRSVSISSYIVYPEVWVYPWLKLGAWYETEYITVPGTIAAKVGTTNRSRFVPELQIMIAPNVRLGLEGNFYDKVRRDAKGNNLDENSVAGLLDFAF